MLFLKETITTIKSLVLNTGYTWWVVHGSSGQANARFLWRL